MNHYMYFYMIPYYSVLSCAVLCCAVSQVTTQWTVESFCQWIRGLAKLMELYPIHCIWQKLPVSTFSFYWIVRVEEVVFFHSCIGILHNMHRLILKEMDWTYRVLKEQTRFASNVQKLMNYCTNTVTYVMW